jgi:glycosyltransferase involved in cell wall biosynthesis
MTVYNHEKYIAHALDSVLMQKVNFKYEIVLGEDCSTDSTREIVVKYAQRYPSKFKLLLHKTNIGAVNNVNEIFKNCTGKYIAMLEGDDYWTDPLKLQKQVDFLERNADFVICFHPVKIWNENDQKLEDDYITRNVSETTDIYELAKGNYIHTPSVLFRNGLIKEYPDEFSKSPVADYFLHMLNAQFGKIKKLPDIMAVYRVHVNGVWSNDKQQDEKIIVYLDLMINYFKDPAISEILNNRKINMLQRSKIKSRIKRKFKKLFLKLWYFLS